MMIFRVATGPFYEEFQQCVTYGFYSEPWQEQLYTTFSLVCMFVMPLIILVSTYVCTVITIARSFNKDCFPCNTPRHDTENTTVEELNLVIPRRGFGGNWLMSRRRRRCVQTHVGFARAVGVNHPVEFPETRTSRWEGWRGGSLGHTGVTMGDRMESQQR
uniref:Uncharacterized protein n=1 Tax=Timema douglasi TaxID=61478 RepID=A0A7R8Z8R6_TIMDO|nr:unnamed protein product [Timema douglasi]